MRQNDDVIEYIKYSLNTRTPITAFISALKQRDHFEKYRDNFVEYGLDMIEYFEITKETDSKGFEFLNKFDILYLHGGDPFRISQQFGISGFHLFLRNLKRSDKIIITTSGSSMVLSESTSLFHVLYPKLKKKTSKSLPDDTEGLHLFPHLVLPHYDRYKKKESVEIIKEYSRKNKTTIYAIYDGSAVGYDGNKIEIIGHVVIFENGKVG